MAGIDKIIDIINTEQKKTSENIISSAEQKAQKIRFDGDEKAELVYREHIKKYEEQSAREYKNSCNSIDSEMKRKLLSCRIECINSVIEQTIQKLHSLPDSEYFALLEKIAEKTIRKGNGIISLNQRDLKRITPQFAKKLLEIAEKKGGTLKVGDSPADIEDGFIMTYGLISENCSFRDIAETEKESIRDTVSKVLFTEEEND